MVSARAPPPTLPTLASSVAFNLYPADRRADTYPPDRRADTYPADRRADTYPVHEAIFILPILTQHLSCRQTTHVVAVVAVCARATLCRAWRLNVIRLGDRHPRRQSDLPFDPLLSGGKNCHCTRYTSWLYNLHIVLVQFASCIRQYVCYACVCACVCVYVSVYVRVCMFCVKRITVVWNNQEDEGNKCLTFTINDMAANEMFDLDRKSLVQEKFISERKKRVIYDF